MHTQFSVLTQICFVGRRSGLMSHIWDTWMMSKHVDISFFGGDARTHSLPPSSRNFSLSKPNTKFYLCLYISIFWHVLNSLHELACVVQRNLARWFVWSLAAMETWWSDRNLKTKPHTLARELSETLGQESEAHPADLPLSRGFWMEFFELCQNFRGNFMKQVIDDDDVVRVCTRFVAFILRMLSWSCIANPPPLFLSFCSLYR